MEIGEAVDKAINDMPADYQIRMFLMGNRAEVKDMCITEYNEAETMKMLREEGRKEGREEGREEGRKEGRKEGQEEGEDKLGRLVSLLILKGRNEDVQKAATDKAVRANLYKEFKIL